MGMEHSTFKVFMCIFIKKLRGEGNDNPFQYSSLENPIVRVAWQAAVHGVTKSQTQLNNPHTYS